MNKYVMLSGYKRGANHKHCQDYSELRLLEDQGIWMGCLSDGHSSMQDGSPCLYSDVGAKTACKVFLECAESHISSGGLYMLDKLNFKSDFVSKWKISIKNDFLQRNINIDNNATSQYSDKVIFEKYGCTFLFVVSNGRDIIVGQLGDGGIVLFNDNYDFIVFKHFTKKNDGSTDSICGSNSEYKLFTGIYNTRMFSNVFIASDGVFDTAACVPPQDTVLNQKIGFATYATELQEFYKKNGYNATKDKLDKFEFYVKRNRKTNLPRSLTDIHPCDDCSGVLFVTADPLTNLPLEEKGLNEIVVKNSNAIVFRNEKFYATVFETEMGRNSDLSQLLVKLPTYVTFSKSISIDKQEKINNKILYLTEIDELSLDINGRTIVIDKYQSIEFYFHIKKFYFQTKTLSAKELLSFAVRLENLIEQIKKLGWHILRGFFETLGVYFDENGVCYFQIHPQTVSQINYDYDYYAEFYTILERLNIKIGPLISVKDRKLQLYYTTFYGLEKPFDNSLVYDCSYLPKFALITSSSGGYAIKNLGESDWQYKNADSESLLQSVSQGRRCRAAVGCVIMYGTTNIRILEG